MRALKQRFSLKLWPNGEFSIGRIPEKSSPFANGEAFSVPRELTEDERWNIQAIRTHGALAVAEYRDIDLTDGANSHKPLKPKKKRGSSGLTHHGKKMVRNGAFLIERECSPRQCVFLTLTIPALNDSELCQLRQGWSEICRIFTQWLSRKLKARGLPGEIVYVSEIQPKRFQRTGQPVPHLHLLFQGRERWSDWKIDIEEYREAWRRTVCGSVPALERSEFWAAIDAEPIRKTASGYMAKYLSKGGVLDDAEDDGTDAKWPHLASWYGLTGKLRCRLKKQTRCIMSPRVGAVLESIRSGILDCTFWKDVYIELDEFSRIWVGGYGTLSVPEARKLKKWIEREKQKVKAGLPRL